MTQDEIFRGISVLSQLIRDKESFNSNFELIDAAENKLVELIKKVKV